MEIVQAALVAGNEFAAGLPIGTIGNRLQAKEFPATLDMLTVVLGIKFGPEDEGDHHIRVRYCDGAGKQLGDIREQPVIVAGQPGMTLRVPFRDVGFPAPGPYSFEVDRDGQPWGRLKLDAVVAPETPAVDHGKLVEKVQVDGETVEIHCDPVTAPQFNPPPGTSIWRYRTRRGELLWSSWRMLKQGTWKTAAEARAVAVQDCLQRGFEPPPPPPWEGVIDGPASVGMVGPLVLAVVRPRSDRIGLLVHPELVGYADKVGAPPVVDVRHFTAWRVGPETIDLGEVVAGEAKTAVGTRDRLYDVQLTKITPPAPATGDEPPDMPAFHFRVEDIGPSPYAKS
jgi:hypothetical protein